MSDASNTKRDAEVSTTQVEIYSDFTSTLLSSHRTRLGKGLCDSLRLAKDNAEEASDALAKAQTSVDDHSAIATKAWSGLRVVNGAAKSLVAHYESRPLMSFQEFDTRNPDVFAAHLIECLPAIAGFGVPMAEQLALLRAKALRAEKSYAASVRERDAARYALSAAVFELRSAIYEARGALLEHGIRILLPKPKKRELPEKTPSQTPPTTEKKPAATGAKVETTETNDAEKAVERPDPANIDAGDITITPAVA